MSKLKKIVKISVLSTVFGIAPIGISAQLIVRQYEAKLQREWKVCQVRYGDFNKDGYVTPEEAKDLSLLIGYTSGAKYIDGVLTAPDGSEAGLKYIVEKCNEFWQQGCKDISNLLNDKQAIVKLKQQMHLKGDEKQ